ncbi:hypothetical protein HHX47_DHR1002064 [Lentinula edodes]|nr:hypothetical protein HHX47_DHR1002064 [Lentinula edodes]
MAEKDKQKPEPELGENLLEETLSGNSHHFLFLSRRRVNLAQNKQLYQTYSTTGSLVFCLELGIVIDSI